jgi:excisionase family DNA binding protein
MFAPKLMSMREAAAILGVPYSTLHHWALHGTIDSRKIGGRRMIPVDAVEALVGKAA